MIHKFRLFLHRRTTRAIVADMMKCFHRGALSARNMTTVFQVLSSAEVEVFLADGPDLAALRGFIKELGAAAHLEHINARRSW